MAELPFPHHTYDTIPSSNHCELIAATDALAIDSPQESDLPSVGDKLRSAQVVEIVLIHGTFAGNDILGFVREVARFSPKLAESMRRFGKRMFDQLAGELGNYTQSFADQLSELVNAEITGPPIRVTRFAWSGENHHLGRAGAAVALIDRLLEANLNPNHRILVWAHSHGGNVLAMLGHLLTASVETRQAFFAATKSHYRDPVFGRLDLPLWEKVRDKLQTPDLTDRLPSLDVVTFGTPLRYRWRTQMFPNLLHVIQHRPTDAEHPMRATLPDSIEDIMTARGGDYVQQLGIGGTDFLHAIYSWRSWNSERRLRKMFAPGIRRRDLPSNLRRGLRASPDGTTLLVDYPDHAERWNQRLIGHGVYTRPEWLVFHLREIANRFWQT